MMKVLVAVDASETAQYAVQFLSQLRPAWRVTVLHVIDVEAYTHPHLSGGLLQAYHTQLTQQLRQEANRLLSRVEQQLHDGLEQAEAVVREGRAAEVILTEARTRQVDLIMLGNRGLSTIPALLLGSVSYRVSHHAPCAVLLVKRPVGKLRSMIIGVDRSVEAQRAAVFAAESGLMGLAERTIIATVTPAASFLDAEDVDADRRDPGDAASFIRGMQQELSHHWGHIQGLVLHGEPAAALLTLAEKETADLIVVGARGRTRMQRLLLGSVSQKVMMHATCAVLTVRSPVWKNKKQ
jgi:nucleotide-binding universal stress UspA family protein